MMSVIEKTKTFLPYGRQSIDQADIDAVVEVLQGDYLTTGPAVVAFENALAKRFDAQVVAVNSGTAALHLAYRALGIGTGDYVIVPAITFLATANAALLTGAEVVFADVDPETGLMGPKQLQEALDRAKDKNIRAVAPVHMGGQTEQLSEIYRIARDNNLLVIEDACHAIGTDYVENHCNYPIGHCQHSDVTVFSFHPVKTIAMGEGGAVATRDQSVYRQVQLLRNHGMTRDHHLFEHPECAAPWYYEMQDLGLNYRVSDIHCALGLSQLNKLDTFRDRRRALASCYDELLKPLSNVLRPVKRTHYSNPCWHLYSVLIDFDQLKMNRADFMMALRSHHIGTQVLYIPVNEQPFYEKRYGVSKLLGAKSYYQKTLSLPLYPELMGTDVEYVVSVLQDIINS